MLIIGKDSHLDHGLSAEMIGFVLEFFGDRSGFFRETITLPAELGQVPCGLHGPLMGDDPVPDSECIMESRGKRGNLSRMCDRPTRMVSELTVIAGPHEGHDCYLFTTFGGPVTPKEPTDPTIKDSEKEESEKVWAEHALSR